MGEAYNWVVSICLKCSVYWPTLELLDFCGIKNRRKSENQNFVSNHWKCRHWLQLSSCFWAVAWLMLNRESMELLISWTSAWRIATRFTYLFVTMRVSLIPTNVSLKSDSVLLRSLVAEISPLCMTVSAWTKDMASKMCFRNVWRFAHRSWDQFATMRALPTTMLVSLKSGNALQRRQAEETSQLFTKVSVLTEGHSRNNFIGWGLTLHGDNTVSKRRNL